MSNRAQRTTLLAADFVALTLAFFIWAWLRHELGFFAESDNLSLLQISLIVNLLWILFFAFFGFYDAAYAKSRVDEFIQIFKTISLGVLIIFLVTFETETDLENPPKLSRMFILNYWLILLVTVTAVRMLVRTIQRYLLSAGIGHRRTVIVGWGKKGWDLADEVRKFPALGLDVVGFVSVHTSPQDKTSHGHVPLLGNVDQINAILEDAKAQQVIFALKGNAREKVMDVMDRCNGRQVDFKIVPDLYDIVVGQARTNQIYGLPLIDVMPHYLPEWERKFKRLMDLLTASIILLLFSPLWLLLAVAIKLDSKGPVLYQQERVGFNGRIFNIHKFRSMVHKAESQTGPRWAEKKDPRITRVGNIIRKLRLDEVPQFINVLKGEMSLIGPRPERPYFVEKFKQDIPFYARRLKVKPGITGWAQIKGEYDTSIENVKDKLKYDLFYLENMSLRMDAKVILNTIYIMLRGKGQ